MHVSVYICMSVCILSILTLAERSIVGLENLYLEQTEPVVEKKFPFLLSAICREDLTYQTKRGCRKAAYKASLSLFKHAN